MGLDVLNFRTKKRQHLSRLMVAELLLIEMANTAEQTSTDEMLPGCWMREVSWAGGLIRDVISQSPPIFNNCTIQLRQQDEESARSSYLHGLAALADDYRSAEQYFVNAHLYNPWIAEPRILLGIIALYSGDWGKAEQYGMAGTAQQLRELPLCTSPFYPHQ